MQTFQIDNYTFQGYLAMPEKDQGTGVLLLQAWWGLNDFISKTCERLAEGGFVTLAPDLFQGEIARTIDEAKALRKQLERKAAHKIVQEALRYLADHLALTSPHLGTFGFSLGCGFALEAARMMPKIVRAVVLFYGTGGGKFDRTQAAYLGHFAENDKWGADQFKRKSLEGRLRSAQRVVTFYTYPNTLHWFFEDDRPEFSPQAAGLAWERSIQFLRDQLQAESKRQFTGKR